MCFSIAMTDRRKNLWQMIVTALALTLLTFLVFVVVTPSEKKTRSWLLYSAVVSPIVGTSGALIFRAVARKRAGLAVKKARTIRRVALISFVFAAPGAIGIMLLWIIPRKIMWADLTWWRVLEWIAIFWGLTIVIGFFGGILPELIAQRIRKRGKT